MLSVILFILKIIGIVLLALFCLLLFLVLVVLFVPVRYRVLVEHGNGFRLEGRVSWLLHILHGRISLMDDQRHILLRIFGFPFYDSNNPGKSRRRRPGNNSRADRIDKLKNISRKETADTDIHNKVSEERIPTATQITKSTELLTHNEEQENKEFENKELENNELSKDELTNKELTDKELTNKEQEYKEQEYKEQEKNEQDYEERGLLQRLLHARKRFKARMIRFFRDLKKKLKNRLARMLDLKRRISLAREFIRDEINQEGIKVTFESTLKLLKHLFPTKLKSRLIFGTGDPCSTGQALGAFAILYSFYGDHIEITPDFENKVFEGKHYARGRIRIWTILIIVSKLLLDKKFKQLRRNYKLLKEAL